MAKVVKQTNYDGISLLDNGKYQVVARPWGRNGKQIKRRADNLASARRLKTQLQAMGDSDQTAIDKTQDKRTLGDLINLWWTLHGMNLKDGESRKGKLENIRDAFKNIQAIKLTATMFGKYREARLEDGASARTVNHDLAYMRALFNTLESFEQWPHPNPVAKIKKLKEAETQLTYLDADQRKRLLAACNHSRNRHLKLVVMICFATGCRWNEAVSLRPSQVVANRIQFVKTKNDKRRLLPIPPELGKAINEHDKESRDQLFRLSTESFENALDRAKIKLPKGQLTHVLRHTFAVTFMESGGSIHTLQRILGHSTITTTAIYLAYAPDNLGGMLELNPLAVDKVDITNSLAQQIIE